MIEVVQAGLLATIQDLGRPAARIYGVPLSGAMDRFALQAANLLAGNPAGAAALELTGGGMVLRFLRPTAFALAGADLEASLDNQSLPAWGTAFAHGGAQLHLAGRRAAWGARSYLAPAGGFALAAILGSYSTYLAGGFGGLEGRPLRAGDQLLLRGAGGRALILGHHWPRANRPPYKACPTLRLLPGPHLKQLAPGALQTLLSGSYRIGEHSNRQGYRLEGPRLHHGGSINLASLGVVPGVVQVPPDGLPILLMADAQTTGGYPVAGAVIAADLPLAGQLLPGDRLRFSLSNLAEARGARLQQRTWLEAGVEYDESELLLALAGQPGP